MCANIYGKYGIIQINDSIVVQYIKSVQYFCSIFT